MLNKIGIIYDFKNIGCYKTKKDIEKTKLQMRLSQKRNLVKLRGIITIPYKRKDRLFTKMIRNS